MHQTLAHGRWRELSLCEQMGNIGSEVSRMLLWRDKGRSSFEHAQDRAFELFELTLEDPRWRGRLREIARAREVFADAILGGTEYQSSLEDLERYFFHFAYCARQHI
ncbi:MAG TPA: hypothetical protein VJC20_03900 [Candidatus Paceibacterota bacterium]